MMHSMMNGRNPRTKTQIYNPMHYPFANYCTENLQKSEMKFDFENQIYLNKLHLIPDPLMKNLADTIITGENTEKPKKQSLESPKMPSKPPSVDEVRVESTLAGITNFFSGVFNMLSGAMFRTKSPVDYDCFDATVRQGSSQSWHPANNQDKNGLNELSDVPELNGDLDMNNCDTVISCEEKLTQVRCLLSKPTNKTYSWRKRPKKVFVEPGSVEDIVEDAFSNEDFVSLSNDTYMEFHSPPQYQTQELCETEAPKTKIDIGSIKENTEIVMEVTASDLNNTQMKSSDLKAETDNNNDNMESKNTEESLDDKQQLVSSCEDKLSKLKALLQEKRTKNTKVMNLNENTEQPRPAKTIPISKPLDKQYKDPHWLDKNQKMKPSIQDDVIFANDIDIESTMDSSTPSTINSSVTSLGDHFDEVNGRFRSTSATESEDSFQIVFNDSPKHRRDSDCDSEDSFIVFEDHDCYTSTDVFRESDSESDVSDSGCGTMTCKLSHSMSRTVSNLTDDTLYESCDEVDCAKVDPIGAKSLLMDANKRSQRKDQPAKKVHFSEKPPTVKVMRVWAYAARQARAGHWERYALDRERFKRRIADVDMAVSWVLKPQHRSRVMFQRFMPLWNRQRRQELAEKKEAEVKRKEEERIEQERIDGERMEPEKKGDERIDERNEGDKIEQEKKEETDEADVNEEKGVKERQGEVRKDEQRVKETQKASRRDKEKKGNSKTQKNKPVIICH